MLDTPQWQQVLTRDPSAAFVYAVSTTGIFCRPACPSRRPRPAHVRFFATAAQARAAGFRPCLRCRPEEAFPAIQLTTRIAVLLDTENPSLDELARELGRTPATLQRTFTQTTGVSPKVFAQAVKADRFRTLLAAKLPVTDAIYAAGFSAPSRASQAAPLGMAPKHYRKGAPGERIACAILPAPLDLGFALLAATPRGLCAVLLGNNPEELRAELQHRFRAASLHEDPALAALAEQVFSTLHGPAPELSLDLRATAFQAQVWAALRRIPRGETRTYSEVAASLGRPTAARAVARACAVNPVAIAVPCHRVVGKSGALTGYRWGLERKQRLLAAEGAPAANQGLHW